METTTDLERAKGLKMKIQNILAGLVCVAVMSCGVANALGPDYPSDFIDFEAPTVEDGVPKIEDGDVSFVTTPTNRVQFGFSNGSVDIPRAAQENSGKVVGFYTPDGDDLPAGPHDGEWSLGVHTTQNPDASNPAQPNVMIFDNRVTTVSFDLYDFRADGNMELGTPGLDQITLVAFDGLTQVALGTSYTVPDPRPEEGSVEHFTITHEGGFDKVALRLDAGWFDRGTAIDNVSFQTVPEPASLGLAGLGLVGLLRLRRRRS